MGLEWGEEFSSTLSFFSVGMNIENRNADLYKILPEKCKDMTKKLKYNDNKKNFSQKQIGKTDIG